MLKITIPATSRGDTGCVVKERMKRITVEGPKGPSSVSGEPVNQFLA